MGYDRRHTTSCGGTPAAWIGRSQQAWLAGHVAYIQINMEALRLGDYGPGPSGVSGRKYGEYTGLVGRIEVQWQRHGAFLASRPNTQEVCHFLDNATMGRKQDCALGNGMAASHVK